MIKTKSYFLDPLVESVINIIKLKEYNFIDSLEELADMTIDDELDEFLEAWK